MHSVDMTAKKTCATTDFACKNGQCVPARWRCDGEPECPDGSDEADSTCSRQTCPPEKFDCGGHAGKCVSLSWRCDGERDCENGEDEEACAAGRCNCRQAKRPCLRRREGYPCLPPIWFADGVLLYALRHDTKKKVRHFFCEVRHPPNRPVFVFVGVSRVASSKALSPAVTSP
ncbi:hypothetical protein SKAU_G00068400 [Synaphobranchus kaupii]|uniref:Uncharacterized protein n=1 Tax=Synaphobranchus kaupii TaxID=118154 RepID=A0A9Q1JBG3_SYNKA|nr:hypothetical protein SKAU_G00068400 [Synaphobranchus kaupii]